MTKLKYTLLQLTSLKRHKEQMQPFQRPIYRLRRWFVAISLLILGTLVFLSYNEEGNVINDVQKNHLFIGAQTGEQRYLINTTNCKIPDINPFNEDVLPFVKVEEYEKCSNKPLLTYIEKFDDLVKLKINQSVIHLYSYWRITCCYSKILREKGDEMISHSNCKQFEKETTISYEHIRVTCKNIFGTVYKNVHTTFIPHNKSYLEYANNTNMRKIYMIGIDSISRLNLQRTMPKTFRYLNDKFVSFDGYNKMEDNTFPNLMAVLAGRDMGTLGSICKKNQTFDDCDLIWRTYKNYGYVTAYGEDEPNMSTFNYYKQGFVAPPTDFYLRPYFLSAYKLDMKYKYSLGFCSGPENTAERTFNAIKDFAVTMKDFPTFSLFWINCFSHDNVNLPSSMDTKFVEFLTDSELTNILNDSIVIIFSDHGFRFGDIRFTYTGWMEERLPFLYFKFPESFKERHSALYKNFMFNAKMRLVTPFDFHMTLKHLLKLSNDTYSIEPSIACPNNCRSLFEIIPEERSCEDASIPKQWCTCDGYYYISAKETIATEIGRFVVAQINRIIDSFPEEGGLCAQYDLQKIVSIGLRRISADVDEYLIMLETNPKAMFEATLKRNGSRFELLGDVSRLNKYRSYTSCIKTSGSLKKYCFCDGWLTKVKSGLCYLFSCWVD